MLKPVAGGRVFGVSRIGGYSKIYQPARHLALRLFALAPSSPVLLLAAGILCLLPFLLTPTFHFTVASGSIKSETGNAYSAPVQIESYIFVARSDSNANPERSKLLLYENGKILGPAHTLHDIIRQEGRGTYSHWNKQVLFSASDNSDPRSNGRAYSAEVKAGLSYVVAAPLAFIAFLSFIMLHFNLKRRYESRQNKGRLDLLTARTGPLRVNLQIALAIIVVAAAFATAYFYHPYYKTNDDYGMRSFAENMSAYLFQQNTLIALPLRSLYRLTSDVPWYDLELATGAIAGAFICQLAILRLCGSYRDMAFCAIAGFLFFAPIFQAPQFTASAILLAGGALLLFASVIYRPPVNRQLLLLASVAIVISFFLGALVRFHVVFLVLIIVMPVVGFFALRKLDRRSILPIGAVICGVVFAFSAHVFEIAYYAKSQKWADIMDSNKARSIGVEYAQLDTSRPEELHAAFSAAGWSKNDYDLFSGWLVTNAELFSAERVNRFAELAPHKPANASALDVYNQMRSSNGHVGLFFILCFAPALLRWSWFPLRAGALSFGWTIAVLFAVGMVFKPGMLHIVWPLYAVVALLNAGIVFVCADRKVVKNGWPILEDRAIATAVLAIMAYLAALQIENISSSAAAADKLREKTMRDLSAWPAQKGSAVIVWDHNFPYEVWARPFLPTPRLPAHFIYTGSAYTASPFKEAVPKHQNIYDIAWAMCNIPEIYMVDARLGLAKQHEHQLVTYMREHYRQSVKVSPAFEGEALTLYVCSQEKQ
jgi:hypothetical protein